MLAILKKELWSYFGNWTAWTIIGVFSLVSALFLFFFENDFNFFEIGSASMQSYFILAPWLLLFIIPALSMRSLAEEYQSGTLFWLFSLPIKISEIILGKFLAVWIIGCLCLLPSLVYLYTLNVLGIPAGNLDLGSTLGSYFGAILLIGAFAGLGVFSSAVAKNQIMAFLLSLFLNFIFYFGLEQIASYKLLGGADFILQKFGFYYHFMGFTRGLIDSKDLFYFLFVILLTLLGAGYFVSKKNS